jgi:predicted nucleotidyltransferase
MVQINELLGSRICIKILDFFLKNPSSEFTQSRVRKKLGIAKLSAMKWLNFLVKNRILLKRTEGRMIFYKLDRENVIVKQLKILFTVSELRGKLERLKTDAEIWLFGSASRGEDFEDSDIDILVIGRDRKLITKIKSMDERIKVSFFTPVEWLRTAEKDKAFYERVEKDKIRLV